MLCQEAAVTLANRGTKRRCPHCGAAYYDLDRSPVVCPKCQTPYVEAQKVPVRAIRSRPEPTLPADEATEESAVFAEDETLESEDLDSEILSDEEQEDEDGEERD